MSRNEKAIGAWRHSQIQTGVETKATESQQQDDSVSSCPLFKSSRTQKTTSLSSCEAELHAIVSSASDGTCIRAVLAFARGTQVDHYIYTDSPSAHQLVMKRGVGKVRVAMGSKQERPQYKTTWRTKNQILDEPRILAK